MFTEVLRAASSFFLTGVAIHSLRVPLVPLLHLAFLDLYP
jgi:hypothetical protein